MTTSVIAEVKWLVDRNQQLQDQWDHFQRLCREHGAHGIGDMIVQRDALREQVAVLRDALWCIANPIAAMQRGTPEGHAFNGHMAVAIADKPHYYTDKAREALAAPTDTAALDARLAQERERCAVVAEKSEWIAAKIRSLK
jgi:hypothetical protein